jgi:hypothetical protein
VTERFALETESCYDDGHPDTFPAEYGYVALCGEAMENKLLAGGQRGRCDAVVVPSSPRWRPGCRFETESSRGRVGSKSRRSGWCLL